MKTIESELTIEEFNNLDEEWFTIDSIELAQPAEENTHPAEKLYCISVDSPEKQFLIGKLGVPTHNTDEAKEQDELKGEAQMIIGSIARLGRAAGVHIIIATQRPDATLIPGETRDNLAVRVGCGTLKPSASTMLFGSNVGQRIHSKPKGGIYIQIHGRGNMGQGFFAPNSWLDDYFERTGKAPAPQAISSKPSMPSEPSKPSEPELADTPSPPLRAKPAELVKDLDDTAKKAPKEFVEYWDEEMEEIYAASDE